MGICQSNDEASIVSKNIDKELKIERQEQRKNYKLLLLGSGESGKSTFFKQIKIISSSMSERDKLHFREIIQRNCISQMQGILKSVTVAELTLATETESSAKVVLNKNDMEDVILTSEVVEAIKICWNDPACRETYNRRGMKYQLNDAADYFFENIDRFKMPDYQPTEQDILRTRVRTTGIEEAEFTITDFHFKLIDVGGQRTERRKWLHCFDNVTAVFYFVALNEYDMNLREDDSNRMLDSLSLFEGVCNSPWFEDISFILLLNKADLFREKIKNVKLNVCFPDYDGTNDFEDTSNYIKDQFLATNRSQHDVFIHLLVAVDTNNVKFVFDATREALLSNALNKNFGVRLS